MLMKLTPVRDENKHPFLHRIASVWTPLIYKTNFHRPKYKYNKFKNFQNFSEYKQICSNTSDNFDLLVSCFADSFKFYVNGQALTSIVTYHKVSRTNTVLNDCTKKLERLNFFLISNELAFLTFRHNKRWNWYQLRQSNGNILLPVVTQVWLYLTIIFTRKAMLL